MFKKALVAILALAIVSMMFAPAFAWEYYWCGHDEKYEQWGPHVDEILIKMYSTAISEWEQGLENGEIDITDWPLDHTHLQKYTLPPWTDSLKVMGYGAEFGLYLFDLNNNNNTLLGRGDAGNPFDGANPKCPNPMGYKKSQSGWLHDQPMGNEKLNNGYWLRHAIAHLVNRDAVVNYVGTEASVPVYTPLPPCYGKYCHPDITPGGLLEDLTHPYDPAEATSILDDSGIFPINPSDGWRYWDRNLNGHFDADYNETLVIDMISRVDDPNRDYMGTLLETELLNQHIHVVNSHLTITAARIKWMTNKDAHIYTAGWSFTATPDVLTLWQWQYYWHPGRCYNTAGCNKQAFNDAADGVSYANTQEDAVYWARLAQEIFCDSVLSIAVFNAAGYKVASKTYVGAETGLHGQYWYGMVNWQGYGVDNFYTFLNMHPSCSKWCQGTIRYGFKTQDLRQLNPIYTEWLWDNTVLDMIYGDTLVARNPYTMAYIPWVCKTYRIDTYNHPIYGLCSKIVFTLRNDVYFNDGTQLSIADIYYTFVEMKADLAARGLPVPWWISNVQNILSFSILDPLNFEVLLDVKSMWAIGWIGGSRILPKHIWKPICKGAIAPKSNQPWDPTTFAPDPDLIGMGPWRLDEYVAFSHILMVANKPSRTVDTDIKCLDPNKDSEPIHSPYGYFRLKPKYIDIHADNYRAKILCKESVPACNPQKWMWVNLTATDHNLWMEQFNFTFTGDPVNPVGSEIVMTGPEPLGCIWQIVNWVDQTPNGILDYCDIIEIKPINPPPVPPVPPDVTVWFHVQWLNLTTHTLHVGQCIITDKYVYVDGNLISRVTAMNAGGDMWIIGGKLYEFRGWIRDTAPTGLSPSDKIVMLRFDPLPQTYEYFHVIEYTPTLMVLDPVEVEKPCIPIVETFTVNLTKCFHNVTLAKYFETEWFLCPNNILQHYPYDLWIKVWWPIWVTIKEDITGSYYINSQLPAPDCKVDLKDVFAAGKAFGSVPGDAKWNTVADINGDYKIDLKDYFAICKKFGKW